MTSTSTIKKTEYTLLRYLGMSLRQSEEADLGPPFTAEEWQEMLLLADRHEVLPLLENGIKKRTL